MKLWKGVMRMTELLKAEHLSKNFGGLKALSDINITVFDNEIFGIIGPNGAGKTTLFNNITGFDIPSEGKVYLEGKDMTGKNVTLFCKEGIARTFQNIRVFSQMTVLGNVLVGMHKNMTSSMLQTILRTPSQRREEREAYDKAHEVLKILGIDNVADKLANCLPYGTQRKVEIARALISSPKVLLLDEPTAGMNPQETDDLMHLIAKIRDLNITVIVIEHNIKFMLNLCNRIAVLNFGQLLALDVPEKVKVNPEVIKAYIGEGEE